MDPSKRIVLNTIILYIKVIVCILLSLVSVPIVLRSLGAKDYGLYTLIAGAISMLSFLNASMALSIQRYMAVAIGEKNGNKINRIYNVSFVLHLLLGVFVIVLVEFLSYLFFDKLNIDGTKLDIAWIMFHLLAANIFITVISVPLDAVLNATENMIMYSVFSIMDNSLKLILALLLAILPGDKLLNYCIGIICVSLSVFILK